MEITNIDDAPAHSADRFVAVPVVEGEKCSVRVIRLSPGQSLPEHGHGESEVVLLCVDGEAMLTGGDGEVVPLPAGGVARLAGSEMLRAACGGAGPTTLVAFLTPPFPPRGT